jgi:hypothetical protein
MRICWFFLEGVAGKGPGLKPFASVGLLFAGLKPCAPSRKTRATSEEHEQRQGRSLVGERGGRLWGYGVRRGPSTARFALRSG